MFCLFHNKKWEAVAINKSGSLVQLGYCSKCGKAFWRYV